MVPTDGAHAGLAISNILIIGNQTLSTTILRALCSTQLPLSLTILTPPSRTPPSIPPSIPPSRIRHSTTDFTVPSLRAALADHDLVISTIAGGDYALQTRIVNAAVAAGVGRFMPCEFGPDSLNAKVQERLPPSAERARVVRYLRGMESAVAVAAEGEGEEGQEQEQEQVQDKYVQVETSSGFDSPFEWVAVAVGCILDAGLISGDLGFDLKWQSATVHGDGTEEFAATSLERVGKAVVRVVERWDEVKNQYLYAAGCITTANQIVDCLRKGTGQDWTVGNVDTADCIREASTRMERGFPDAGMLLMERSVLYDRDLGAVVAFKSKSANALLGLEEEKVEAIVSGAVHDFKHRGIAACGCD